MNFSGMNYLAIAIATVAAFGFGALWYGALSKQWLKASRIDPADAKMEPSLFIITFVMELVLAIGISGIIGHLGAETITLSNGLISGLSIWFLVIMPTMIINQRYQDYGWDLTVIDGGHWLGVALIIGGIVGWFGI